MVLGLVYSHGFSWFLFFRISHYEVLTRGIYITLSFIILLYYIAYNWPCKSVVVRYVSASRLLVLSQYNFFLREAKVCIDSLEYRINN